MIPAASVAINHIFCAVRRRGSGILLPKKNTFF
jgi:hypothetical protein